MHCSRERTAICRRPAGCIVGLSLAQKLLQAAVPARQKGIPWTQIESRTEVIGAVSTVQHPAIAVQLPQVDDFLALQGAGRVQRSTHMSDLGKCMKLMLNQLDAQPPLLVNA